MSTHPSLSGAKRTVTAIISKLNLTPQSPSLPTTVSIPLTAPRKLVSCAAHRGYSSDFLDGVVRASEDTFAVVLGDFDEMLHQERREFVQLLHLLLERLDRRRLVLDLHTEDLAHG